LLILTTLTCSGDIHTRFVGAIRQAEGMAAVFSILEKELSFTASF
jgi:hypothetical protein